MAIISFVSVIAVADYNSSIIRSKLDIAQNLFVSSVQETRIKARSGSDTQLDPVVHKCHGINLSVGHAVELVSADFIDGSCDVNEKFTTSPVDLPAGIELSDISSLEGEVFFPQVYILYHPINGKVVLLDEGKNVLDQSRLAFSFAQNAADPDSRYKSNVSFNSVTGLAYAE